MRSFRHRSKVVLRHCAPTLSHLNMREVHMQVINVISISTLKPIFDTCRRPTFKNQSRTNSVTTGVQFANQKKLSTCALRKFVHSIHHIHFKLLRKK
ncbi:hypothetical protein PsorP6_012215 [Peronosclerospora sorghi]|uniref:Uncharacterized protein n=1 Tax=Peronosclerospora sorghi TaxID=230839 RepID=A0ACC0WI78_9STRA|nr:hypothetical protein PsorP6_012215 [Peronosclerospora sorghi]